MTAKEALEKAIRVLGSQTAVAAAATPEGGPEVKTGHVYYWLNKAPEVPAEFCPGIERATRALGDAEKLVVCEELCPSVDWSYIRRTAVEAKAA